MKEQPYSSQILNDPRVQHRGGQFSFLNRMRPNESNDKENQEILDTRETTDPTELSKVHADKILQNLSMLAQPKFTRTKKIVNLIKESKNVVIDKKENFIVDATGTGIKVPIFLYDLQQPTKKINNPDYFKILEALIIKEDSVINSNAKIAIRKRTQRDTKQRKQKENFCAKTNQAQRNQPITYRGILSCRKRFRNLKGRQNSTREGLGVFRRMRKNCFLEQN